MTRMNSLALTAEEREASLQQVIDLGAKQGFLTLEQIRLHLPYMVTANTEDEEAFILRMNNLGIAVFEQEPIERPIAQIPMGHMQLGPDGCSITFSYICNLKWEDLTDIGEERVRLCAGCNQFVKQIREGDDISAESALGFCGTFMK